MSTGIDPTKGMGKLNWIPEEYDRYQTLKLTDADPAKKRFQTTCRYRLPRNYVQGTSTSADLKKVFFVINGINTTWFHYHLSRLLPDWLFVCLDLRYNGYDSQEFTGLTADISVNDSNGWVGDIRYCYDDVAFCYDYFNIISADTVCMYGNGTGATVALGFYNTFKSVADGSSGRSYKITQLILNSPDLKVPDQISSGLTSYLFNPLSYVLGKDYTQIGVLSKIYDSVATVAASGVPQVLGLFALGGASGAAIASVGTVAVKQLLATGVGYIPSESTRDLAASISGTRDSLPYVTAQDKSYYLDDLTMNPKPNDKTLIYAKSVSDVQATLTAAAAFITCPTIAIFSDTIVSDTDILSIPGDNVFIKGTSDYFIGLLGKMSTIPITSYKFPDMYNDVLLSTDLFKVSKVVYSLLVWMQASGIVLNKDSGDVLDMTTVTVNNVYDRIDHLLVKSSLVPDNTPYVNTFALMRAATLASNKANPVM